MNLRIRLIIISLMSLTFWHANVKGQDPTEKEKTIYLMRAKQFYGSGVKMNLMINGELFHKIKSGNRLIIKTSSDDTLNIQIIYPLIKSHKSKILQVALENRTEVYIDLFYSGEVYNPLKHAGVLNPLGGTPEFNIEILEMTLDEGKKKFNQPEKFKDNKKIMEKRFPL